MNEAIEISKLIDRYFPAEGVGTEREQIRMEMHNDIAMLVKNLTIPHVSGSLHIDFAVYLTGHDKETIEQMFNDWRQ